MSRVGKIPIKIPEKVECSFEDSHFITSGPLGKLNIMISDKVQVTLDDTATTVTLTINNKNCKESRSLWGLYRVLINNAVTGVSQGFQKTLLINGVGYKAQVMLNFLRLSLGKSHDIFYMIPEDINITTPKPTEIIIKGANKEKVGKVAADICAMKKFDPYKLKGIYLSTKKLVKKVIKKK